MGALSYGALRDSLELCYNVQAGTEKEIWL
jgi:hypothetical protein